MVEAKTWKRVYRRQLFINMFHTTNHKLNLPNRKDSEEVHLDRRRRRRSCPKV